MRHLTGELWPEDYKLMITETIDTCPEGTSWIQFIEPDELSCPPCPTEGKKGKSKGTKKKPSGYNLYMSDCMKSQGRDFSSCATGWKSLSDSEKNKWREQAKQA